MSNTTPRNPLYPPPFVEADTESADHEEAKQYFHIQKTLRLLKDATDVTHQWRRRVHNKTGYLPPVVAHRVLLALVMHEGEWLNSKASPIDPNDGLHLDLLAGDCGIKPASMIKVALRLERDELVTVNNIPRPARDVTPQPRKGMRAMPYIRTVTLTPLGRELIVNYTQEK